MENRRRNNTSWKRRTCLIGRRQGVGRPITRGEDRVGHCLFPRNKSVYPCVYRNRLLFWRFFSWSHFGLFSS